MKATIKIEMDNAAFEDGGNTEEVGRILRSLAAKICKGGELMDGDTESLFDANGNKVGSFEVTE